MGDLGFQVSLCDLGFMSLGFCVTLFFSLVRELGFWVGVSTTAALSHFGGGTWRLGFLSSMETVTRSGRFEKGRRSGMGTLHRLWGVTNGGCRGPGGPLDSPLPVPIS